MNSTLKKIKDFKWQVSIFALIVFCFSLLPMPNGVTKANESLGAVRNADGTVTISVEYSGDSLYLVGDMTDWAAGQIEMTKGEDGIFRGTTKVLSPGTYGYKFKPNADNWNGDFNQEGISGGANSSFTIKPLGVSKNDDGTVTFRCEYSGENLTIAGNFTEWASNPIQMKKGNDGVFEATVTLNPGSYEYKYKDGDNWFVDPANANQSNGNSAFTVVSSVTVVSPVDNKDGTVTFSTQYNGDTLYLIGSMVNWDVSKQIPMTKGENNVFSVTIPLEKGSYQYKFKPKADSWSGAFADPNNTEYAGENSVVNVGDVVVQPKKTVIFKYVREDKDYDGWNIWTWSTGAKDGQQDFVEVKDGEAISKFQVANDATSVGFALRKGTGWDIKDPYDSDRYINIDPSMKVIKVKVTSGVGEIFQVPAIKSAVIDNGKINFKYRNEDLFAEDKQDELDKVQLKVSFNDGTSTLYDMDYDSLNEYFGYTLNDIKEGAYKYSFIYTKDGVSTETEENIIEYKKLLIGGEATVSPEEINSDENAVLDLQLNGDGEDKESIREINLDLSNLGGPNKVGMELNLFDNTKLSQTIAVSDSVSAGEKEIPITVVDKNGESHELSAKVTVKTKNANATSDFGFDESRIYFAVTDRFLNGDESNDDPNGNNYDKTNPFSYHGGDLKGLTEKVPYLSDLGINVIWITPIVENTDFNQMFSSNGTQYSYHGYWAKNFEILDPHLGTMSDLKTLIDTAHENGIKIMVDVVLNHTGYGMKAEDENGNGATNNYPTDEDRKVFDGMIRTNPGSDAITQESSGLPDLVTENLQVRNKIIEWQTSWLEKAMTDKGNTIDYFRVDTVKHVDNATWKAFKNKLTSINPEFKLIGEYYGADVNTDGGQLQSGQMDGLLDFAYKNKARDFVNGNIDDTAGYLDTRADKIDNTRVLGQFLSSHDENGFLTSVNYDLGKQMVAASLQITDKGVPVIYYGEELAMTGLNGMDNLDANRYDMDFSRLDNNEYKNVYNHYKKLLNIRKDNSLIFAKGNRKTIAGGSDEKYSAFERSYNGESIISVLNVDESARSIDLEVPFNEGDKVVDLYSGAEYVVDANKTIKINVPSMSEGGTSILKAVKANTDDNTGDNEDNNGNGNDNSGVLGDNDITNGNNTKTSDNISTTGLIALIVVFVGAVAVIGGVIIKKKKRV
ncbi:MAG: hypothetical protein GX275_05445 [Clostridiales bacterium]|nr:hypothetical protein [Clostridiales bacterium]